jgi:hypothetical protein
MQIEEQRQGRDDLSEEEVALLIAKRKQQEAEAEEADERERIKTIIIGLGGLAGLLVGVVGFLVRENLLIGSAGFIASFIAVGVITAGEGAKLLGRG